MPRTTKPRAGLDVRLPFYTSGGISRYIRYLATALPSRDPSLDYTHFYNRKHSETYSPLARRVNCWTPAHHRLERLALAAEIMPYGLDLLHSPDFIPPLGGYRRSIITVHDLTFLLYPEFLTAESRRYYNDQIRWAVKRCDAISADSRSTQADLMRLLDVPPEKITVIQLGLDPAFCPDELANAAGGSDAERLRRLKLLPGYVLFVGTFEPRKNIPGLLRAYAALRRRWPEAPDLVLAGRHGWLFDSVLTLVHELHLDECTRFLPEVAESDLPALYRQAKVFVLPSHYEGFGFTALEAMGCGTPAVVANRASLPEIAGDAALLVEPDDAESIAEALCRCLTNTHVRDQMRQRGLERAAQFTWDRTAQATLDLYRRVLSS